MPPGRAEFHHGLLAVTPLCNRGLRGPVLRARILLAVLFGSSVSGRQWVLSLPHRVRYALAWDHALCRAVVGVYMRAVLGDLRRRARAQGVSDGRGGGVAIFRQLASAESRARLYFLSSDLQEPRA